MGKLVGGFLLQTWRQELNSELKLDLEVTQELRKRICLFTMKNSKEGELLECEEMAVNWTGTLGNHCC